MVVSFCGVVQPKLEKPELLSWSPAIASTFEPSGPYAPGVLNGVERQRPAAASGGSNSSPSSPSLTHGATMVGWNFHFCAC